MRKRILILTAVEAEREAVLRGLGEAADQFEVCAAGVGIASAAAAAADKLSSGEFGLVISAGIGGGFEGAAQPGMIVVSSEIVSADLGAETSDGFQSVDRLGLGESRIPVDLKAAHAVMAALAASGVPVVSGCILSVSTVTGTAQTAQVLARRIPGAAAEAMEGFGAAVAAGRKGVPVLEIRSISNAVGPRDRGAWRIKEALQALEKACIVLPEVFT